MAAAKNEKVASRASALKQQNEYQAIADKVSALELTLNGKEGQPGARAYQEWYAKNLPEIQRIQGLVAKYQERYGELDAPAPAPKPGDVKQFSQEDVQRMV